MWFILLTDLVFETFLPHQLADHHWTDFGSLQVSFCVICEAVLVVVPGDVRVLTSGYVFQRANMKGMNFVGAA